MPRVGGIVAAIVAVLVLILVLSAVHLLPQLRNPFAETTTVRSQPVILKSITNLSRYEAASGSFQVVVDLTAGRIESVQLAVDRTVENHQGKGSSYRFRTTYAETYMPGGLLGR